ncbi:hypothetical protein HYU92_01900 [Candidatus Curtissbacteria bacterium]|nr:hypothetical protein [Candidatus Curtissbacteria bacterium]
MSKEGEIVELKVGPGLDNDMSLVLFGPEFVSERERQVYERLWRIQSKLGDKFPPRRRERGT